MKTITDKDWIGGDGGGGGQNSRTAEGKAEKKITGTKNTEGIQER